MAGDGNADQDTLPPTVFLSYASEDRAAARSIRDALALSGLVVWYDENELGGGDEWDQKIRRQIRECDFFLPVISARTEARHEGYFRREWRLAVDRMLDMADGHLFLIPVVIDDTAQATARVPDRFASVQWIRVPNGQMTPALKALCSRMVSGGAVEEAPPRLKGTRKRRVASEAQPRAVPEFPVEDPGQRVKFWFHVVGWSCRSVWILFQRLPSWVRIIIYFWLFIVVLARGCSHRRDADEPISPETAAKLNALSEGAPGGSTKADVGLQGIVDIARSLADSEGRASRARSPLLAIPFMAAAGNADEAKLADSAFTLLYGRLAISHQGQVGLSKEPLASLDAGSAAERGRSRHSAYVLCGGIEHSGTTPLLTVDIVKVADGSLVWTKSYAAPDTDPATIAADIEAHVPSLVDN